MRAAIYTRPSHLVIASRFSAPSGPPHSPTMLSDTPFPSLTLAAFPAILLVFLWLKSRTSHSGHPLPPGPPRLPIIGNALDIPTKNMEATFRAMNEQYGAWVTFCYPDFQPNRRWY